MTKIVCISDTHNSLEKIQIPDGDVLVHTGDATFQGKIEEIAKFNLDMMKLPHPIKIFVPGNHDFLFETKFQMARTLLDPSIQILDGIHNTITNVGNIKIFGSAIQPNFHNWAFNRDMVFLEEYWKQIPNDIDILLTHCPPYGIGDLVRRQGTGQILNVGDRFLGDNVERVKPKFHIFGHIHEGYGFVQQNGTTFINASIMTKEYVPLNKPIVFHI